MNGDPHRDTILLGDNEPAVSDDELLAKVREILDGR